jgi:hypothetical protein
MPAMRALPAALSVLLALGAAGCGAGNPQAEIRALLEAAEEAAEARDAGFFGALIADAYRDARGHDRDELLRTIRGYFVANQRIEIVSRIEQVTLEGADAARAVVHAGMLGRRTGAALLEGVDADLYRFELELVNDGGDWRIIGAEWGRALGE